MSSKKDIRKTYILDTSVLLYDKQSIHSFPGNDVVIPLRVLDEIDRFKERPGIIGEGARYINRFLDTLRENGRLDKGVMINDTISQGQNIRVSLQEDLDALPPGLRMDTGDNYILATASIERSEKLEKPIILITKDINLRVKCDALGIPAEDYYKDHISDDQIEYCGYAELYTSDELIDQFYEEKKISKEVVELAESYINQNQFIILKGISKSALARYKNGWFYSLDDKPSDLMGFESKNKEQKFACDALLNQDIPIVTLTGIAGSGKTYVTLMAAMDGLKEDKYKRIILTRSIQPVGKELGFLPGSMDEKMQPWLAPIADNFKTMFSDITYFKAMREKGEIEVAPLSYIRGRTFNDCFIIVDEAQNATIHELKTIITRVGKNSKIVLLGDTDQIDTPYINKRSNGLSIVISKFRDLEVAAHVKLEKGQRSELASIASKVL